MVGLLRPGGSLVTRSVHPWVVDRLNRLVTAVGGNVEVYNPFLYLTKGEVCRVAREAGLSDVDLAATVSCGNHPAQRRQENCGYCYPCLIRRSGLLAAGGDPTAYLAAVTGPTKNENRKDHTGQEDGTERAPADHTEQDGGPDHEGRQNHLADLQSWLARPFSARDLIADMPLPVGVSLSKLTATVQRGRDEIAAMLRAHGRWTP